MRILQILFLTIIFQVSVNAAEVPFGGDGWEIIAEDHRIEEKNGETALFLKNGRAFVKNGMFQNGIIEFDVLVTGERGFSGVRWRIDEDGNGENFYIRPHQSGQEDANQYTPIFNGLAAWQLYFGPRFSVPVNYSFNEWIHIKVVISGDKVDFYIDSDEPVLHVTLKHPNMRGGFGINSGFAPAWFANFRYEAIENPEIVGAPAGGELRPGLGAILNWSVSSVLPEVKFESLYKLPDFTGVNLLWSNLEVEDLGYANLARVQGITPETNTVLAKVTVTSSEAMTRMVQFGYSDRVKVYLNGALLYSGDNTYRTRDYRYLGTIGLFDEVPLDLEAGDNELVFAVSESFGGWAIMAAIEDQDGLEIKP